MSGYSGEDAIDYYAIGQSYYDLGRYDEAIDAFLRIRSIRPDDSYPLLMIALSNLALGRTSFAKQSASQALQLDPENTVALRILATCHQKVGEHKEAKQLVVRALAMDPSDEKTLHLMAICQANTHEIGSALEFLEYAQELDPINPEILVTKSALLNISGKPEDAKNAALLALSQDAQFAQAHVRYGEALQVEGNVKEATASMLQALRHEPNNSQARHALMEAIRSNSPVYRSAWTFLLQVRRLEPTLQWALTVLPVALLKGLVLLRVSGPAVMLIFPLIVAYLVFILTMWFGPIFLDVMASFDSKFASALTRPQKITCRAFAGMSILGPLLLTIGFIAKSDIALLLGCILTLSFLGFGQHYGRHVW